MKVKDLVSTLQKFHDPDDEIAAIWWSADEFDYLSDDDGDEVKLTLPRWRKVVAEFENWEDRDASLTEWLQQAVLDTMTESQDDK